MAKDAKGHGSDARGGGTVSQITLGGKVKSTQTLADWNASREPNNELGSLHDSNAGAAQELAGGHPKSDAVSVHPGAAGRQDMWGRTDQDLAHDYGGPVRHNDGKKPYVSGSRRTPMKPGWA